MTVLLHVITICIRNCDPAMLQLEIFPLIRSEAIFLMYSTDLLGSDTLSLIRTIFKHIATVIYYYK